LLGGDLKLGDGDDMAALHAFTTAISLEVVLHDDNDIVAVRGLEVLETEVIGTKAMGLSGHNALGVKIGS
jgi:hypothetical protein